MKNLFMTVSLVATLAFPTQASSQMFCGRDREIKDGLERGYGEVVTSMGSIRSGSFILLFVSPVTKSWSVVKVDISGIACIIASGDNWDDVAKKVEGKPL